MSLPTQPNTLSCGDVATLDVIQTVIFCVTNGVIVYVKGYQTFLKNLLPPSSRLEIDMGGRYCLYFQGKSGWAVGTLTMEAAGSPNYL